MKEKFEKFLESKGITQEQLKSKSAEELAALYNDYNALQVKAIEESIEKKASKEDIDKLREDLSEARVKQMEQLNEVLKQHGVAIKKLTEKDQEGSPKFDSITKTLEDSKATLEKMKSDKSVVLNFKAAGTMLISSNVSGGNVPVEQRLDGVNMVASRRVKLLDILMRGSATSNVISWVYQANQDGAAGGTAEGASKNQIDFDLVVAKENVKKRTAFIKASTEMLTDIAYMESLIRLELMKELLKDVESQVYAGDNVGENLNGIRTVATAFAAGTFAGTVDNANFIDVLRVAMDQILVAEHDSPTYILAHPSDVTTLKLIKASTTDKRYVDALQIIAGNLFLDGVPILQTTLVTKGQYLVGNFELAFLFDKGEIAIEIGLDADDFTKNLRTILAEWRGLVIVKNNDRTAFVKGVIATDAAALETP